VTGHRLITEAGESSHLIPHKPSREVTIEPLDARMVEALRGMTERQRLEIAWDMWRSARNLIEHMLRSEHPDWSEQEVALEVGRRLLGQSR